MSIKSKPYYWVVCDEPGCDATSSDLGDFSAWGDEADAIDEAADWDWEVQVDGKDYCEDHRRHRCEDCRVEITREQYDEHELCDECLTKRTEREGA